ncbi:hypothetical protein GUITHDRAFT_115760 [Guillardia theta CCMP2712]|uniref:Uncharacterized protein n=1 Tax=Guillardia theta (strain CCMP2712) TaxID=905079 RepID=L1IQ98_GUITC|nr:hypothetical protein GUITHDRAFT_115760 [Guillardia theta CCMP2712]EKX38000.1 hypothetical protein GUITHDRAFT_115760 [Guillardia theta CCMP2712]|eukprot:XP_005824980.1 hypothetical protein GUITHDRAFT_115760 [Guillardia theta CCMP2712]
MPSVPWLYVLEKLWHDDQGEKVVHDKCLLASKVSLVCKEWAGHVRAGQMGNSFEQEIAKSLYSDILEDGRGIPRIKVQDSLKKEIEIELCRRSSRIPVEHFVMSDFISLISTAGSIAAFAHVIPKPSELVLGVNCWRGSIGAYVNHSLSIYCLKKATVVNQFPSNNRINALHVSVSNEIFAADQDGYVKVYSSVDSEAPWSETTTRVWRHPAQEAISCMSIREGNEHKEGSLQGLQRPTRNADYFISTSLDTVGLFEDVSLRQLAGGGMGQLFHMGLTFVESARLACSGNVLICAELVENNIPMRVWYLHGSRTSKWPAVTRALCKSALYQLLIRDKGVQISTKDRPYREVCVIISYRSSAFL